MTDVVIERLDLSGEGFFGRLLARGLALYTGELPWHDNLPSISCIPPAPGAEPMIYEARWTFSPRFRRHRYLLLGTDPRTGIRKHPANLMGDPQARYRSQLNGCIALGERLGWIERQKALLLSTPAVRRFEEHMQFQPFRLEIRYGNNPRTDRLDI